MSIRKHPTKRENGRSPNKKSQGYEICDSVHNPKGASRHGVCSLRAGACEFHHAQKENVSLEFPLVVEAIRVCVLIMYACGARRPGLMWRYGTTLPVLATQSPPSLPSHGDAVSRGKVYTTSHHRRIF